MFGQILVKYTDLELSEMTVEDFKKNKIKRDRQTGTVSQSSQKDQYAS